MEKPRKASQRIDKAKRKGFNSAVILGAWILWIRRNKCVSNGASASLTDVQYYFQEEMRIWCLAGARNLLELGLGQATGLVQLVQVRGWLIFSFLFQDFLTRDVQPPFLVS